MEFLSSQYNDTASPVNLVLQSPESLQNGYDAAQTGTFDVKELPFAPDDGFHEYRFDWSPDAVSFYADGVLLRTMNQAVPSSPGHITFSHWSNGDPKWSGGPPAEDAVVTLSYFKGYFNSSLDARQTHWEKRCKDPSAPDAICAVPDMADDVKAQEHFFTKLENSAENQTVSDNESGATSGRRPRGRWDLGGAATVVIILAGARLLDWCL